MESDIMENLMPRDLLEKSNCCRFCANGGTGRLDFNLSFFPMYEQSNMLNLKERLDNLINRYLPLKVDPSDVFYPRLICSTCYYSLEETIQFFDKITLGQKILMKIINQNKIVEPKRKVYSEDNPLLQPPKRRGRPKKDPNKPKEIKPPPEPLETLPTKPKRTSRPPVRYIPETSDTIADNIKIEIEENEEGKNNWNPDGADAFLTLQQPGTSSPLVNLQRRNDFEFDIQEKANSLLELAKLNIIMAGDDVESDTPTTKESADGGIPSENFEGAVLNVNSTLPNTILNQNSNTSQTGENADVIFLSNENGNESDASVKTIEFIKLKKKKRKKKPKKPRKTVVIKCPDCEKEFGHRTSLAYHRAVTHEASANKFVCGVCSRGFTHRTLLATHMNSHSNERPFKCDECILKFKNRSSLHTHKKSIHSNGKQFTCDKCAGQFSLRSSLRAHARLHSGERPYVCEFCKKAFAQRGNLIEHRRIHTGERPYKCVTPNCDKAFSTASQLKSHTQIHANCKPYLCATCGKGFAHRENFKYHLRRHTGDKRLECPLCSKSFIEPWALKKHWRMHTGERPYLCPVCHKDFADASNFAKHKRIHEGGNEAKAQGSAMVQEVENASHAQAVQIQQTLTERLIAAGVQVIGTNEAGTLTANESLMRVLNPDGSESLMNADENQQFIYVYPDNLPIFTITLNSQQAIEVRASDEGTLQALGNLAGGPISFTTVGNGEGPYFNLETYDGTTTFVPVAVDDSDAGGSSDMLNSMAALEQPNISLSEDNNYVSDSQNSEQAATLVTVLHVEDPKGHILQQ